MKNNIITTLTLALFTASLAQAAQNEAPVALTTAADNEATLLSKNIVTAEALVLTDAERIAALEKHVARINTFITDTITVGKEKVLAMQAISEAYLQSDTASKKSLELKVVAPEVESTELVEEPLEESDQL